jgi:hypothetical protein
LKRTILIGTALAMLICAGVAYAALNTYSASLSFKGSAGTAAAPAPLGYSEVLGAKSATAGDRAAPLIDIKTTIDDAMSNYKDFPTCSSTKIDTGPKYAEACPKGSLVGTGTVDALLGGTDLSPAGGAGTPCKPDLDVLNGGGGTLWFFFTTPNASACGGLTTGQTAPYPGKITESGKNEVVNVPLPPDVSTVVAGHNGLYGSLIHETLSFPKLTTKVKGKTVAFTESLACKGKRAYTVSFTATDAAGTKETKSVSGSASCG